MEFEDFLYILLFGSHGHTLRFATSHRAVAALKRCLTPAEKYANHELQLFEEDDGETMMNDSDTIALHADTYFPGSSEDNPIALVYRSALDPFSEKLKVNAACSK